MAEEPSGTRSGAVEAFCLERLERWLRTDRGWRTGLAAVLVLAVPTAWTGYRMLTADPPRSLERRMQLAMSGGPDVVREWLGRDYRLTTLTEGLQRDLAFVACSTVLLAVAVLWVGQNYRTATARALTCPLFLGAIGAGVLGVAGDVMLLVAIHGDGWAWWQLITTATWGAWIVSLGVVAYVLGGLLSLLLPRRVVKVLQRTGEPAPGAPEAADRGGELGLAFSGGGIRAASISLGALQQFEAQRTFAWGDAARVTAVSGGAYMAGAWSIARERGGPECWVDGEDENPGPEERHLRANLGYLLLNAPRQTSLDTRSMAAVNSCGQTPDAPRDLARAERSPGVLATVLTGLALNAFVFLSLLWVTAQLFGWFYRWYFSASCPDWRRALPLSFGPDHQCLSDQGRPGWPIAVWLGVGLAAMLLWVLVGKGVAITGPDADGRALRDRIGATALLLLKHVGYSALAISGVLAIVLAAFPLSLELLWRPVSGNGLLADAVAVAGGLASGSAALRLLRRPLARIAPIVGGALFALVLAYLGGLWTLDAMVADPDDRHVTTLWVLVALLLAIHLLGSVELWSLAPFYRGKIRGAFATYRDGAGAVHPYRSGGRAGGCGDPEPSLADLTRPTPLTVCASATVRARGVRTHADLPALSVTFCHDHVRVFLPHESDGEFELFQCDPWSLDVLLGGVVPGGDLGGWDASRPPADAEERLAQLRGRPTVDTPRARTSPRLTTMLAVGLSSAAVSPAMGRFRIGPISMLLAFFNVRLGMWIPNPRYADALAGYGRPLPRPGLGYLLKEFVGYHDPTDLYLYVTDGGHWENTGLVELLRSRDVAEAVCVDADSGPGNLATSIARAVDLAKLECDARGVLRLDQLRADRDPSPGRDYSPRSVNLGLVERRFPGDGSDRIALLWYAKPALTEDMPPHLLAYREVDTTFPRVSTVNQFFHVSQFAAYRDLGRYNAGRILAAREALVAGLARHPSYPGLRDSRKAAGRRLLRGRPVGEDWVLDELVGLIELLARQRNGAGDYRQEVYDRVREIVGADRARPTAPVVPLPRNGSPSAARRARARPRR